MKMMRRTRTASTKGVMLISFLTPPFDPAMAIPMTSTRPSSHAYAGWLRPRHGGQARLPLSHVSVEKVEKLVVCFRQVPRARFDPPRKVVEQHDGRNSDEKAECGGHQRFGDTGRYRAETSRSGGGHGLKRVDDDHDRSEQSDERCRRRARTQPALTAPHQLVLAVGGTLERPGHTLHRQLWVGARACVPCGKTGAEDAAEVPVAALGRRNRAIDLSPRERTRNGGREPNRLCSRLAKGDEPFTSNQQRRGRHDCQHRNDKAGKYAHMGPEVGQRKLHDN